MTNKEIYEIALNLGMLNDDDEGYALIDPAPPEVFEKETSKDLVSVMNFVEDLVTNNGTEVIEKFLVALIYNNGKENK